MIRAKIWKPVPTNEGLTVYLKCDLKDLVKVSELYGQEVDIVPAGQLEMTRALVTSLVTKRLPEILTEVSKRLLEEVAIAPAEAEVKIPEAPLFENEVTA